MLIVNQIKLKLNEKESLLKHKLIEKQHGNMSKLKDADVLNLDEESAMRLIDTEIKIDKMMSDLQFKYYEMFKSVLSPQKVAKLMVEEKNLMRKIMRKECKEEKSDDRQGQRPTNELKKKPTLSVE